MKASEKKTEQKNQEHTPTSTSHDSHVHLPKGRLSASAARRWEDELRGRLGLLPLDAPTHPRARRIGWIITAVMGLLAAFTRFFHLSHPKELIFDETYYVKDSYSLLHHGFEAKWAENVDGAFVTGDYSGLDPTQASYVVHPPLGKWILAFGQWIFGSDNGMGWRFSTALLGVLAVMLVVRIALRLFRSPMLAGLAGFAMALDGMGIVMSRTGLLDNVLAFFILVGFWAVLRDREHSRARLAHAVAHGYLTHDGKTQDVWGPHLWYRPWLLVAAIAFGASMGVKWSGIYAVAIFGILVFIWGMMARRAVGARLFVGAGVFREGVPAFIQLVPLAFVTYIASWFSWFTSSNAWDRQWAKTANLNELPISWAPDVVNSFLHYHMAMWDFHNGLSTPHPYQSQAWAWIVQARPVSFYWKDGSDMAGDCSGSACAQTITSIGNIAVWWLGVIALLFVIVLGIRRADWRAGAIGAGYVALWLPWFIYSGRTIFQFYAIVFLPFVVLALVWAVGAVTGALGKPHSLTKSPPSVVLAGEENVWDAGVMTDGTLDEEARLPDFPALEETANDSVSENPIEDASPAQDAQEINIYARLLSRFISPRDSDSAADDTGWWREKPNIGEYALVTVTALLIGVVALLWYPLWTGSTISYDYWHLHMLFDSWI